MEAKICRTTYVYEASGERDDDDDERRDREAKIMCIVAKGVKHIDASAEAQAVVLEVKRSTRSMRLQRQWDPSKTKHLHPAL